MCLGVVTHIYKQTMVLKSRGEGDEVPHLKPAAGPGFEMPFPPSVVVTASKILPKWSLA